MHKNSTEFEQKYDLELKLRQKINNQQPRQKLSI